MSIFYSIINVVSTFTLLLVLFSCENNDPNAIIISGKLRSPASDTISIIYYDGDKGKYENVNSLILKNDNFFSDTLSLDQGYYYLKSGENSSSVFLQKGFNLEITGKQFGDSIFFKGKGANENNYLVEKDFLSREIKEKQNFYYLSKLEEQEFLNLIDSLYMIKMTLFNKHSNGFGEDFSFIEKEGIEIMKNHYYASFEEIKQFLSGDRNFKVSDNFPNPFENLNLDDERLLKLYLYKPLIDRYINSTLEIRKTADDYVLSYLEQLDKIITNSKIKEELAFNIGTKRFKQVVNIQPVYTKLNALISDSTNRNEIDNIYSKIVRILPGKASPDFNFVDINNNFFSLNDFKGKHLYIDVWATWCKPCIREIPYLEKLRTEYEDKGITFISICQNDEKDNWKNFVEAKNLKGYQLFCDDLNSEFLKIFNINSIPRFIIIDNEGNIYDADAPRPSSDEIIQVLNKVITI